MMLGCAIFGHSWKPKRVFHSIITYTETKSKFYRACLLGMECRRCRERMVGRHHDLKDYHEIPSGVYQEGYDWINDVREGAEVIKLVKG